MEKDSTSYGEIVPKWDKNDCSVRALATATKCSYEQASAIFSATGRKLMEGTFLGQSTKVYEQILQFKAIEMAKGLRLDTFLRLVPKGAFIVHRKGHAFSVVDGIVNDWAGGSTKESSIIMQCWKVSDYGLAKLERLKELF